MQSETIVNRLFEPPLKPACVNFKFVFGVAVLCLIMVPSSARAQQSKDPANSTTIPGEIVTDQDDEIPAEQLFWKSAREGDLAKIKAAIEAGIDVDVKTEYGATALFFACDRGHQEMVDYLLSQGADPNAKDTFYKATPLTWAQSKGNHDIVVSLLKKGGKGADDILIAAVASGDESFAIKVLETDKISEAGLVKARDAAKLIKDKEAKAKLLGLFAKYNLKETKSITISPALLKLYPGKYADDRLSVDVKTKDQSVLISFNGGDQNELVATKENQFSIGNAKLEFVIEKQSVKELKVVSAGLTLILKPVKADSKETTVGEDKPKDKPKIAERETPKFGPSSAKAVAADKAISSSNWPGFRGNGARGIGDGQNPPTKWNVAKEEDSSTNLKWKTAVAGLGLSCPTVWENRIYLTSAVAEGGAGGLKIGLYGDVSSIEEDSEYEFKVLCYSTEDGKLLWEKTANKTKPAVKRHAKSSHANPTIATDGDKVIAFFGSEGLYCYSKNGDLVWKKDFGLLDSGWFYDPGYQWGFGSSPLIHEDRVILQCDIQGQSFITALDLESGDEIWRTKREEIPSWSTPTVHTFGDTTMVITNGTKAARGYNLENGDLIWSLREHSEIVVPTPIVAHDLIFIASGYSPIQPIYAIKPDSKGDISLPENTLTSESIAWSVQRGGPYMPSPIIHGDYLYCCANSGILTCYFAKTGDVVYKKRMKAKGGSLSFTASPVAADGHLYFTAEDGRVLVVKTGPEFELVEVNPLGESILATPAISKGVIYFRTQDSLIAVGK